MKIVHDPEQHMFVALTDNDREMGRIVYEEGPEPGTVAATHTIVSPEFQGQGLAGRLVDALAGYARDNTLRIVPVCSYVVRTFQKDADKYRDVAAE